MKTEIKPGTVAACLLTLSRIPLSLAGCAALLWCNGPVLPFLLIFGFICGTDFLDGKIARKTKSTTVFGAVADVFCDFFFMLSVSLVLCHCGILPRWMPVIIILKLGEFVITSRIAASRTDMESVFASDILGRAVAFCFYILPCVSILLDYANIVCAHEIITVFCLAVAAGAFISSCMRIKSLRNKTG